MADDTAPVAGPPTHDDALDPGAQVGRYHVLERIGAGGMGVVYAAFDPDLDRKVALKVLQPERLDGDAGSRGHARLIREAKAMAKLSHPNVVAVHAVGVFEERVFIAMEFVEGQTLTKWLEQQPPWEDVIRCFRSAGRGLAAAHARGLVHRDFKPDNVLIGTDGRPRVLDFGLARSAGTPGTEPHERLDPEDISIELRMRSHDDFEDRITRTGGLTGTPAYMAPEQYLSKSIDARTDQFSFCVALWEGLHGARPFQGDSTAALGLAVCAGDKTSPPSNTPVPARIQRALDKGLSQEPSDRFDSMHGLLEAITPDEPRRVRPLWVGAGGATLAVGLYAAFTAPSDDPCGAGEARMEEVWSPTRADALRASFQDVGAAFAADSADAVVAQLDDYARLWTRTHRKACEATHVRREQSDHVLDLRMSCLSRHLRALESTAETLLDANESIVRNAPQAVTRLPSLEVCDDVESLDTWARPPEDPTLAATVQDLRERIAGLSAKERLSPKQRGNGDDVAAVLEEAERTEYGPVIAEARFLSARFSVADGDPAEAVKHLEETVYAALASDHDQVLAMALTQLVQSSGILLSRYDEGLRWSRQAEAAIDRLGGEGPDAANFHAVMCKFLADKGDTAEALPHCHRNVELYERLYGDESISAAHAHEALGIAFFYANDDEKALAQFERARAQFSAAVGETHPDLARIANSLAAVCYRTQGAKPCVGKFEDAVQRASAAYGEQHVMTADFRNNLAQIQVDAGELDASRRNAEQALVARRAKTGNDHPGVAASLRILGQIDQAEGKLADARTKLGEALEIARQTRGQEHRDVAVIEELIEQLDQPAG